LVLVPSRAIAAPEDSRAEALFDEARGDMKRRDFAAAEPKLVESERLDPSLGTTLNLVVCRSELGELAAAWADGRRLLVDLPPSDDRRPFAEALVAALSRRVPKLMVRLTAPIPGEHVTLDGAQLQPSELDVARPVDPGPHHLVISAPGRPDRVESIDVSEGSAYEFLAESGGTARGAPVPSPEPARIASRRPSRDRTIGWASIGVGLAGLAAGGTLGALAYDRAQAVRSDCPDKHCDSPAGLQAASAGRELLAGTVVSLSVAVAATGMGIYFLRRDGGATVGSVGVAPGRLFVQGRMDF
jgi:hypothetical protein